LGTVYHTNEDKLVFYGFTIVVGFTALIASEAVSGSNIESLNILSINVLEKNLPS